MLYLYNNYFTNIDFPKIDLEFPIVGLISSNEFEEHYIDFGLSQSAYRKIILNDHYFRNKIEVYDDYVFGTIKIIEAPIDNNDEIELTFYIKKNLFLLIEHKDINHISHDYFNSSINKFTTGSFTLEKFIFSFLDSIIADDGVELETLEMKIDKLEDVVLEGNVIDTFNETILKYKKKLLSLKNYYEQLVDIGVGLYEMDDNIFNDENHRYFRIFSQKAERLSSTVNQLKESIVQLREVYQSNLDLKLNSTMKLFTVVTSIFLPLTLIVGWYGMNFKYMPELTWKYGYLAVIALSIVTISVCVYIFKKKKLF